MAETRKVTEHDLQKALELCVFIHRNKKDRNCLPYAFHPIRVAEKQTTIERKVIALLHDTIEDHNEETNGEVASDVAKFFPYEIVQSVLVLTKHKLESYDNYVERIIASGDRDAMYVKLSDIEDNTRIERMDEIITQPKKIERYLASYKRICITLGINRTFAMRIP